MTGIGERGSGIGVGRVPRRGPAAGPVPQRGAGPAVEIIRDFDRFLALEPEWNDTVGRAGVAHPFLTHEWIRTWWECFGAGRTLHVVVVREAGEITGIAPLMAATVRTYGLTIRTIDVIHNDHTPRADVIARTPDARRALWEVLGAQHADWDVLQLSRLVRGSETIETFSRFAHEAGCATGVWQGDVSPYLTLPGTWDEYSRTLPAKFRSNLRNRLSRLSKYGEPALEILDDAAAVEAAREDALRLEASGWKTESGTAIGSDPAVHRFYSQLAGRATRAGWLRLMFLTVGGRRIATSYGSRYQNRLFLFKTGYDPAFAACSPFKLLTMFAIQDACATGIREVDFLGDAEPWKLEWTSTSRPHDWLHVFSGTVRARLLHSLKFQVGPELRKWRA